MLDACPADKTKDRQIRLFSDARQTASRCAKQETVLRTSIHPKPTIRRKKLESRRKVPKAVPREDLRTGELVPQTCLGPIALKLPTPCSLCHSLCSSCSERKSPAAVIGHTTDHTVLAEKLKLVNKYGPCQAVRAADTACLGLSLQCTRLVHGVQTA